MQVKIKDISGYYVHDMRLYCYDCVISLKVEFEDSESVLTHDDVEKGDELYWCDNCKEQIK